MYCFICKCKDTTISHHRFPREEDLRQEWLNSFNLHATTINPRTLVCGLHFDDDCFIINVTTGKRILQKGSVPTLLLKRQINFKRSLDFSKSVSSRVLLFSDMYAPKPMIENMDDYTNPPRSKSLPQEETQTLKELTAKEERPESPMGEIIIEHPDRRPYEIIRIQIEPAPPADDEEIFEEMDFDAELYSSARTVCYQTAETEADDDSEIKIRCYPKHSRRGIQQDPDFDNPNRARIRYAEARKTISAMKARMKNLSDQVGYYKRRSEDLESELEQLKKDLNE